MIALPDGVPLPDRKLGVLAIAVLVLPIVLLNWNLTKRIGLDLHDVRVELLRVLHDPLLVLARRPLDLHLLTGELRRLHLMRLVSTFRECVTALKRRSSTHEIALALDIPGRLLLVLNGQPLLLHFGELDEPLLRVVLGVRSDPGG